MAHPIAVGGSVGISLPNGTGTGTNDKRVLIGSYGDVDAFLVYAALTVGGSAGPIRASMVARTGTLLVGLGPPGWIRSGANCNILDWHGRLPLVPQGDNEVIPFIRNDTGTDTTVNCTWEVVIHG